ENQNGRAEGSAESRHGPRLASDPRARKRARFAARESRRHRSFQFENERRIASRPRGRLARKFRSGIAPHPTAFERTDSSELVASTAAPSLRAACTHGCETRVCERSSHWELPVQSSSHPSCFSVRPPRSRQKRGPPPWK